MNRIKLRCQVVAIVNCCWFEIAGADSGWLEGRVGYNNDAVNACVSPMICTGTNFPASQTGQNESVRFAKLVLYNNWWEPIGYGFTDADGNFTINWNDSLNGTPPSYRLRVLTSHKDGRFHVKDNSEVTYYTNFSSSSLNLAPLANGAVTDINTVTMGVLQPWTVYHNAVRAYDNSLGYSGAMQTTFLDVVIQYPFPTPSIAQGDGPNFERFADDERASSREFEKR